MKLWPIYHWFLILFEIKGNSNVIRHHPININLWNFYDVGNKWTTGPEIKRSFSCEDGKLSVSKLNQNILALLFPLMIWNMINIFCFHFDLGGWREEPIYFLKDEIIIHFVHFWSIRSEKVLLGSGSVH